MQVKRFTTSRERIQPSVGQVCIKLAKSSVDLICLSETSPRFPLRRLPKKDARTDVGDFVLEMIGLTGI